jgi:hypothetical protein
VYILYHQLQWSFTRNNSNCCPSTRIQITVEYSSRGIIQCFFYTTQVSKNFSWSVPVNGQSTILRFNLSA